MADAPLNSSKILTPAPTKVTNTSQSKPVQEASIQKTVSGVQASEKKELEQIKTKLPRLAKQEIPIEQWTHNVIKSVFQCRLVREIKIINKFQ